jgi:hypothetical protein
MTVLLLYEERHAKIKYVSINTRHYTREDAGIKSQVGQTG